MGQTPTQERFVEIALKHGEESEQPTDQKSHEQQIANQALFRTERQPVIGQQNAYDQAPPPHWPHREHNL